MTTGYSAETWTRRLLMVPSTPTIYGEEVTKRQPAQGRGRRRERR